MDNSIPLCVGVWKMINDPVIDLYQNLNQSAVGLEVLIESIVNSCKTSTHVFVPPADSSSRGQEVHYNDFIKWLLGRLFYLSASDQLLGIIQKSVDAQVKILRMVGSYSMNMFDFMTSEYLHCLAEILEIQMRPFPNGEKPVYMSRFVPGENNLLKSHLNLNQYSIEINGSDTVCCRFQITALQVLSGVVTTILYCPETSSRAWTTTLSLISCAPYTVKAEALMFLSRLLAEDTFFTKPDFQLMFCNCLHSVVGSVLDERENFNMDKEDESRIEQSLTVLIKVLLELHGTDSVRDNTEILATMTMILLKWRATNPSEEILKIAAKFAQILLEKTPNIHVENGLAEQLVQKSETNLVVFSVLECLIVKEVMVFLANMESSEGSKMIVDDEVHRSKDSRDRNICMMLHMRRGSSTWACILNNLSGQDYDIHLPLLKEAVTCAASVTMRIEKYNTPYSFVFFGKEVEKIHAYILNLLGKLDLSQEGAMQMVEDSLILAGTLLRLPEVEKNVSLMETLIAILSLPWLHKLPLWNNMETLNNDAILSLPNKFRISFTTKVKLFSVDQLSYIEQDTKLASWRWELMKQLITEDDPQVVTRVIESTPLHVLSGLTTSQNVLAEIFNSKNGKDNELAISQALPMFVCANAGTSVCLREVHEGSVIYRQVCTLCDPEAQQNVVNESTHSLEGIESIVTQLVKSSLLEVRLNMIECLPSLSNHLACSADNLPLWLNLLCDKERSIRLALQDKIPCLAFRACWMKKRKMQQHLLFNLQDQTELKRASSILHACVAQLWQMVETSLDHHDGDLQETVLGTIKHLGCVPVDTVILPTLSLLLLAISHRSCLLKPMAKFYVGAVAMAHRANPNDLYVRFKRELCGVIVNFMLMNHYRGDTTFLPSMQKVVQALEIPSWKDFIIMDMHYILPPLIAAIGKDKELHPLLDAVASTADLDTSKLVNDHFQYIYPYLCLNESTEVTANCLEYLEQLTGLSISALRTHSFKGIHNELLLHFEQNKECVLKVLCEVAQDDLHYKNLGHPLTQHEIADFLQPRFLGLLVYLDGKLVNKKVSESVKKRALLSLPEIIKFLGPRHITPVRFKVLATLRTALELNYSNFPDLNCAAWDAFVHSVDVPMLGPLLSTVFISLLPLLEQFPQEISNIFHFLVVDNYNLLYPYFKELYFVPQHEAIPELYRVIQKCLQENRPHTIRDQLEEMMGYIKHENAGVRVQGLCHLKTLLQENRSALHSLIVGREKMDSIVMEVLNALVTLRREADCAVRLACSECIGEIGAVDPGNLPRRSYQDESDHFPFKVTDDEFATLALCHLAHAIQSARDTQTMDSFSLAIQELLKVYGISSQLGTAKEKLWKSFPEDIREIMTPLLTSCYKNTLNPSESWPHPIFGANDKVTLLDWASSWSYKMISMIDDFKVRAVFEACLVSLKRDLATLQFFLPYVLLHTLLSCSVSQKQEILEEMLHVMNVPASEQEEVFGLDSPATVDHKDTATLAHITCTKTVFTLVDFLLRWLREWSRKHGASQQSTALQECTTIQEFVKQIPTLSVARSNYQCKEYPRALMYLELYVKEYPQLFQEQHWMIMKIYARLDEPDAVTGIMACCIQEPSLEEMILAHQMTGQFQDAAACYERLFQEQGLTPNFLKGMVQCYLNLDQPFTALRIAEGFVSERPDLASIMTDAEAEALWRMQMYDELTDLYEEFPELAGRKLWGVQVGKAMLNVKGGFQNGLEDNLMDLRNIVMDSLANISVEKGTYQLGYSNIVKLHMISEIEMVEKLVKDILKQEHESECKVLVQDLVHSWNERLQFVQQNSQTKEPILCLRRTLLELAKKRVETRFSLLGSILDEEIGKCWLQSAISARKDGIYQQAYTYILNAEKYHLKELSVEKARLYWVKGEQEPAFSTLRRGLEEYFSDLDLSKAPLSDRKLCAEAKLLFATYNDETVNVDVDQNISNYKEAVEVCKEWEKSMVCLAQYYDRVFNSMADEEKDTKGGDMQVHMIKYFGKSLYYGCNYIYQSMPRLLSIWLDFGSRFVEHSTPPQEIAQNMAKMNKLIDMLLEQLPSYMFLTAFSQLTSRICHPQPEVYKQLKNIIVKMIVHHTQHAMWMFMSVLQSSYSLRSRRCQEMLNSKPIKQSALSKLVTDYTRLAEKLIELTNKHLPLDVTSARIHDVLSSFPRLLTSPNFSSILMPVQKFCTLQLPVDMKKLHEHNPFPKKLVHITGIADRMCILPSLQRPRRIAFKGSDGKEYMIMCKAKDDLRKDFRLMEFNNIVNRYLRKDPESRQRGLHIRTYSVVPLNEECGLIEWVPNLVGLRPILLQLYKEKKIYTSGRDLKSMMCDKSDSLTKKRNIFIKQLLPIHPPVFDEWFRLTFPDPYGWYQARTSYIRTTAVMSMVGYILGLGDRHGENILFDSTNGDTVHVDFNCLFNKGENFEWAERVPFRLTHNMVAGMGPMGVEGVFRRSCEITLRVLRSQIETLMSVLRPFVYDPMVSWHQNQQQGANYYTAHRKDIEITNDMAVKNLQDIELRLQGMVRTKGKSCSLSLSVEGQANNLILEATSIDNLCQMYVGWGPFL